MSSFSRSGFLTAAGAAALAAGLPRTARAAGLAEVGVDYAYYNPPSLILKQKGWLDEALAKRGTKVNWVLSLGSNKGNEFVQSGAVAFGSTAGSAALLARANGTPLHSIFLYSQPEWTAVVVAKTSPIRSLKDLKGKKIAATRGTDPWFFLLRSLQTVGYTQDDVQIVDLQHPDGRLALERGQVDAWAGLDPHMAASQLQAGSRLLYRNVSFNTYGSLNSREDFLQQHADVVAVVLQQYERARAYAAKNVKETATILARESKLDETVALLQLRERTKYPGNGVPDAAFHSSIAGVVPLVKAEKLARPGADLESALKTLADVRPAQTALRG